MDDNTVRSSLNKYILEAATFVFSARNSQIFTKLMVSCGQRLLTKIGSKGELEIGINSSCNPCIQTTFTLHLLHLTLSKIVLRSTEIAFRSCDLWRQSNESNCQLETALLTSCL